MSSSAPARSHLFTFLLPDGADFARAGAAPDVFGCLFEIGRMIGFVSIYGSSREAVFEQASQLLSRACPADRCHSIAARLYINRHVDKLDQHRDWLLPGGGVDSWTIIFMGGQTAFAPTALGATFPVARNASESQTGTA